MLSDVESAILRTLLADGRKSFRQVASELGVATSTVIAKVNDLREREIIRGFTCTVDWEKLGYSYSLCLAVQVAPDANAKEVGAQLGLIPNVVQVFSITGDADFSVHVKCRTNTEASEILEKIKAIPGIGRIIPHTVLTTVKDGLHGDIF
jgi:Lrp/AsnC family leucine-responsive transcriptional regulator